MELDHIRPLFKGGADEPENWQGLCVKCHERKTRDDLGIVQRQTIGADGWPID
jgi:5-methylcytosine-specific restriction protein A